MSDDRLQIPGPGLKDPVMVRWVFRSADGRLRAGWRVAAFIPAYVLVASVAGAGALGLLFAAYQLPMKDRSVLLWRLTQELPYWPLLVNVSGLPATVVLVWLFRRFLDRRSWKSIGFQTLPAPLWELLVGAWIGVAAIVLTVAPMFLAGNIRQAGLATAGAGSNAGDLVLVFVLLVAAAFGEELVVRGYLLNNVREAVGSVPALLISAGLFSLLHGMNPGVNIISLVNIFLAGLLMGSVYVVTGRLWAPWLLHVAWNATQGLVLGLPVSGISIPSVFHLKLTGSPLATGGSFGPEASLWNTAAVVVILIPVAVKGASLFGVSIARTRSGRDAARTGEGAEQPTEGKRPS